VSVVHDVDNLSDHVPLFLQINENMQSICYLNTEVLAIS